MTAADLPDASILFGYAAAILAGLAVLAVLAFVIVWAVLGILRELARHRARTMTPTSSRYWPEHSAVDVVESIVPPPAP